MQAFFRRPTIHRATRTLLAAALLFAFASVPSFAQRNARQHTYRSLTGTVTNPQHEPLRGAVVKLQNADDQSVITFLVGNDGHYSFKRISANVDYTVWATFRNSRSKAHFLSKFNSNFTPVLDLQIKLE